MNYSTFTTIKERLRWNKYFRTIKVPFLQNLGCEMLAVIYTDFNPAVPIEVRVEKTRKTIAVFEELFLSIGETNSGFSLSFAKDYTSVAKINDIRIRLFVEMGILESDFPSEAIFPFEVSKINRFLDMSPLLKHDFGIKLEERSKKDDLRFFEKRDPMRLTDTEKLVFYALVKYPVLNNIAIGKKLHISRHTVSNVQNKLEKNGLIKQINIPNLKKIGYEILSFCHYKFNPQKPITQQILEAEIIQPSTIFAASRNFECVTLSVCKNYDESKSESARQTKYLKENNYLVDIPIIRLYRINKLIVIKDLVFAPFVKKLLGIETDV
jgi:DNA-binding Lrp family transcriptional regulator